MRRPAEVRTPPRDWRRVLKASYPFLRTQGIGDLLLYGSQAMSAYMKTPLRSKDLDLVSSQIGPQHHEALRNELAKTAGFVVRSSTIQSKTLPSGEMKIYSVELRLGGRPFFVEILDRILDGKPLSIIAPHVRTLTKWGLDLWVPSPNAVVALRLSFRPPEGISPLNCNRLNAFIKDQRKNLDFKQIGRIITQWEMSQVVRANLEQLHNRHRLKVSHEAEILATIKE